MNGLIRGATRRAAAVAAAAATGGVVAVMAVWGSSPASGIIINGSPARMVGGGWMAMDPTNALPATDARRATIAANLGCPASEVGFNPQPDPPGRGSSHLLVTWGRNVFRLDALDAARCSLGGPDTFEGSGTGLCNGRSARARFRLADGGGRAGIGNPDIRPDTVHLDIEGGCTLVLAGPLLGGNLHMVGDPADG